MAAVVLRSGMREEKMCHFNNKHLKITPTSGEDGAMLTLIPTLLLKLVTEKKEKKSKKL